MAEIYNNFEAVADEVKAKKQREKLAESFSADLDEDESEEIGKASGTEDEDEKALSADGIPGAEAVALETKSHDDSYQASELFDIGRTFAVKLSHGRAGGHLARRPRCEKEPVLPRARSGKTVDGARG